MKLVVSLLFIFSTSVYARQYIQCSDSHTWDRAVVNINGDASTLFMTNGVHRPDHERVEKLKKLKFFKNTMTHRVYITEGNVIETVSIPLEAIGRNVNGFKVEISHYRSTDGYSHSRSLSCFSAIYE